IGTIDAINVEEVTRPFAALNDGIVISVFPFRHHDALFARRDDVQLYAIAVRSPHAELTSIGIEELSAEGKHSCHSARSAESPSPGDSASSSRRGMTSLNRNTAPSGGSVIAADHLRPCSGIGMASTPPRFPCPLPP